MTNPEAVEAIRLADKHLAGASIEKRKALALDIMKAITQHAELIALDAIRKASTNARQEGTH